MLSYPLFPKAEGMSSNIEALISASEAPGGLAQFMANTGTVFITKDTPCAFVDFGILGPSEIRILKGKHVGRTGFMPTEWVNAEEIEDPEARKNAEFETEIREAIGVYENMKLADSKAYKKLCEQAKLISAGTNIVGARERFEHWRAIEKSDCKKAGIAPIRD